MFLINFIFLTKSIYPQVLMIYVDHFYNGISGTLTGWVISYPMGSCIWSKTFSFKSSPYPEQDSVQCVIIFGDMGKVVSRHRSR
jgi:hypothetical protein